MRLHSEAEQWAFIVHKAGLMRQNPTPAERRAREFLVAMGFKAQYPIKVPRHRSASAFNYYILDLYNERARLCVELDGSVHRRTKGRDGRRDRALVMLGIRTLRFDNSVVMKRPAEFQARVAQAMRIGKDAEADSTRDGIV